MIPNEVVVNPQALTAIVLLTNVLVQVLKRLSFVQKNADFTPLIAVGVGAIIGVGTTFAYPDVTVVNGLVQGVVSALTAAGLYDAFHGTKNVIKGTGNGQ